MIDLPRGWEWTTLSEIGQWAGGGTPSKSNDAYWTNGTVPWVSPKDVKRLRLSSTEDQITDLAVEETVVRRVPSGSIVFVVRSGILAHTLPIALLEVEATVNQDIRVLVPDPALNVDWLLYALLASRGDIRRTCQKDGTTVASLDVPALAKWGIAVPPRAEQDRIVHAVWAIREELAQARSEVVEAVRLLAQMRQALLVQLSDCSDTVALSDAAKIQSGITKNRAKESGLKEMPYIRTANVQAGRLDLSEIKTIGATQAQVDRHALRTGDVLVLEGGDADKVGRGWIWEGEIEECLHQNHVFAVRPDASRLLPRFLAHYINAPAARTYFLSAAKQTTNLASINKTQLGALPLPDISIEEQADRVATLESGFSALEDTAGNLATALELADDLDTSVLARALAGDLVSQDPADEPAGELLLRIKAAQASGLDGREAERTTRTKTRGRAATGASS